MVFKFIKNINKERGFSFVELIVTMSVIVILTIASFPFYKSLKGDLALERSAAKLVQDIRRAQEMALSGRDFGNNFPEGGYGICFNSSSPSFYVIFADVNGNKIRDGGEEVETVNFESNIKINSVSGGTLDIIFVPPNPDVFLTDLGVDLGSLVEITISSSDGSRSKTIRVNKAGLVWIE
ncbi:MAG: prepilin-type N-terminal cleavage/methylation domain-containing protein [bacterium]|nr:prepilin-type N-terminal cleavage/methylation domain-containing protein [bacterium]